MDLDLTSDPIGVDNEGKGRLPRRHLAVPAGRAGTSSPPAVTSEMFTKDYADVFAGDERWQSLPTPTGNTFEWADDSTYVRQAPVLRGHGAGDHAGHRHLRRPGGWRCWATRSTTDHILAGRLHQGRLPRPASTSPSTASSVGTSTPTARGAANHEVMIRGTFANIRPAQPAAGRRRGRLHPQLPGRRRADHHLRRVGRLHRGRRAAGDPGPARSTGSGSSRDWAAQGHQPAWACAR